VRFRTVSQKGRKCSAYDLFSCFPEKFSAILEDPDGSGAQHLVSRSGQRHMLDANGQQAGGNFFAIWEREINERRSYASPCIAHLFYAAYEAADLIEDLPEPASKPPVCILWTLHPDWSFCFAGESVHLAAKTEELLDELQHMLDDAPLSSCEESSDVAPGINLTAIQVTDGTQYKKQVEQVKELIAAGDIFQANIARFWSLPFATEGLEALYKRLRQVNTAPFSCFLRVESESDEMHILSASPERLFRISVDGLVDTRPIAGTRRRGEGEMDTLLRDEMLLSDKERAEHIMLVDLERNDLGRVCVPGSVEVNEVMVVEGYATVQHIVSNVRGRLRDGLGLVDVFRAMFPGGTITGCPKVHCMEIIHGLEGRARGPYTGGVGFSSWDGAADMNILIRSFWHHEGRLNWAAGAGIVADSDPDAELTETGHKAEGMMRALEIQG